MITLTSTDLKTILNELKELPQSNKLSKLANEILDSKPQDDEIFTKADEVLSRLQLTQPEKKEFYSRLAKNLAFSDLQLTKLSSLSPPLDYFSESQTVIFTNKEEKTLCKAKLLTHGCYFEKSLSLKLNQRPEIQEKYLSGFNAITSILDTCKLDNYDARDPDTWLALMQATDYFQCSTLSAMLPTYPQFPTVNAAIAFVKKYKFHTLDLSQFRMFVSDSNITIIEDLSYLEKLVIESDRITDKGLKKILEKSPNLGTLDLGDCRITGESLKAILGKFPNLRTLSLRGCTIEDKSVGKIVEIFPNLRTLDLAWCNIKSCFSLTDKSLKEILKKLPYLETLDLTGCRITDTGLEEIIGTFHNLRTLDLSSCGIANKGLKEILEKFPNLRTLNLCRFDITGESLNKILEKFPNLETLNLSWCKGSIDLNMILETFPNLVTLDLRYSKTTGEPLKEINEILKNNPRLKIIQ